MYCFENILLDIIYTFHHAFTLYQSFGLGNKLCLVLSCLVTQNMLAQLEAWHICDMLCHVTVLRRFKHTEFVLSRIINSR